MKTRTKQLVKEGREALQKQLWKTLLNDLPDVIQDVLSDQEGDLDSCDWESFLLGLMDEAFELVLDCYDPKGARVLVFGKGSLTRYKEQSLESIISEFIESSKYSEDRALILQKAIRALEAQALRLKQEYEQTAHPEG